MTILDIALSSANNWPDVQSILDRTGEPGSILWIETAEARRKRWGKGAVALLGMNGREVLTLQLSDQADHEPSRFAEEIQAQRLQMDLDQEVHLHLNGGTKWMQVILTQAFPEGSIHYIEGERHHLKTEGGWSTEGIGIQPDLEAILMCYGFERKPLGLPKSLGEFLPTDGWGPAFVEWQISHLHMTEKVAKQKLEWFSGDLTEVLDWSGMTTSFDALAFSDLATSKDGLALMAWRKRMSEERVQEIWCDFQLHLDWWIGHSCGRWTGNQSPPSAGHLFEKQVSSALAPYAQEWGVHATHQNWTIVSADLPQMDHAELDILWLLKSGRTVVFECKAWNQRREGEVSTRKDLAGRLENYRRSLGSLSQMVLCLRANSTLTQDRLDATRDLVDSLGLPEPLWVSRRPTKPIAVSNSAEILPPLAEQMQALREGLRL